MARTKVHPSGLTGLMGKNLLINPLFSVNQRGYVSGAATTGGNQYTVDRWRVVTLGQNLTFSGGQATAPAGGLEQVIEGANIQVTGTYVLNWTGTATAKVDGVSVANGGTFTLTAGTNSTVRFTGGTVQFPQIEYGVAPTSFEFRSFILEEIMCKRYYEVARWNLCNAGFGGGVSMNKGFWSVAKRTATPNLTLTPDSGTGAGITNFSSSCFAQSGAHGVFSGATVIGEAEL